MSEMKSVVVTAALAVGLSILLVRCAHATDCPEGAKSCKVITLTPDEEAALVNPRMVFDTAATGRAIDLANVVAYFRSKIATAPAGTVPAPPEPPKQEVVPTPTPDKPLHVPVPQPDPRK